MSTRDYVIRAGTLFDGTGRPPMKDARILVRGQRIGRIERGPGSDLDDFPRQIDASDRTVLPGLIDSHTHFFNCGGSGIGVGLGPRQVHRNFVEKLRGGVTSALDVGAPSVIPLVARLPITSPRVFYVGPIVTCRGGYPSEYMPRIHYKAGVVVECESRADVRRAVRRVLRSGGSMLKTAVVSRTFRGESYGAGTWTDDLLKALTDEAHSRGLKVGAHITYPEDYAQAIRCGIDSIHHAAFEPMHDEDLDEMVERGMVFVPTVSLGDLMVRGARERWIDDPSYDPPVNSTIRRSLVEFTENFHQTPDDQPVHGLFLALPKRVLMTGDGPSLDNLRRFAEKGGAIALGTDAALGFSFHTCPVREVEMMREAGMSVSEVIRGATLTAASVFSSEHELGSLEVGKLADILIIDGDLEKDISSIGNTHTVILGGRVKVGAFPCTVGVDQ